MKLNTIMNIKKGKDVTLDDGSVVANDKLTLDPQKPKSYAFCSDTSYKEDIVSIIKEVTMLYHESTFLEQHEKLALETGHSTAKQAGIIAKKAAVGGLILGHYSTRYNDLNEFKEEAKQVFDKVALAEDGKEFLF